MIHLTRRDLMRAALLTASAAVTAPVLARGGAEASPKSNPLALLGVASGDPTSDGVVLWARLALDLADTERWGLDADAYRLTWEMQRLDRSPGRGGGVRHGTALALREKGYAVHVEVDGLAPDTRYRYTFRIGDFTQSGTTRTAPARFAMPRQLRFCACSCAEYENELFFAYDEMAKEKPDFIVHLGDYIYEETYDRYYKTGSDNRARRLRFDREVPLKTVGQYRRRYAEHKADPMLQRAHAAAPWIVTWDDHEVANDYAATSSADETEADFLARVVAGYRAYFENLPIRLSTLPVRAGRRQLYRQLGFGRLMSLHMLDERQYRDPQACRFDKLPGGKNIGLADCPSLEAARTVLGPAQEQWVARRLSRSRAHWNVLAQGVMFAHLETRRDPRLKGRTDPHMWNDTWSGYIPARQRMVDLIARRRDKNSVFLSGDIHAHFVNRVHRDWRNTASDVVAPEFVCAAVSSFVRDLTPIVGDEANRPVIAFHDSSSQGYMSCTVTPDSFETTMVRIIDLDRQAKTATADRSTRFRVERGDPEPHRVA